MLDDFKEQYIAKVLNGSGFDDELNQMFETILIDEMNDDPEKMGAFIQSIVDENTPKEPTELEILKQENQQLKADVKAMQEESEMTQAAFMELSDYVFSK